MAGNFQCSTYSTNTEQMRSFSYFDVIEELKQQFQDYKIGLNNPFKCSKLVANSLNPFLRL